MANAPSIPTRSLPSSGLQAEPRADFAPATSKSVSHAPVENGPERGDRVFSAISSESAMARILDLARWAPSGDNTQPWRFEIISEHHVVVHGRDTRDECVYDLRGNASHIALGALLETIAIAASIEGFQIRIERRTDQPDSQPTFDVRFESHQGMKQDPLAEHIRDRVTQRRPMRSKQIEPAAVNALSRSLPSGYTLALRTSFSDRFRIAKQLYRSAWIRLTTREAFETHRKVIEWNARESEDRIPDQAVGVDPMTRRLMRWAMKSWSRISFLNRFMGGTILPRLQLDFMPGLRCAGHFFLVAEQVPTTIDDFVAAGRALQRFWLTATSLGLLVQPEMTPLIFSQYTRDDLRFTSNERAIRRAAQVNERFTAMMGDDVWPRVAFMGRLGFGKTPRSRSTRLPLSKLRA